MAAIALLKDNVLTYTELNDLYEEEFYEVAYANERYQEELTAILKDEERG